MSGWLGPAAAVLLFLFMLYRRFRKMVGRQPIIPGRLVFRAMLFVIIGVAVFVGIAGSPLDIAGAAAGLAFGVVLAFFGLRLTRFEGGPGERFYIPNPYLGFVVFALFVGRLAYRIFEVKRAGSSPGVGGFVLANHGYGPLTSALLFAFVGYYVFYYLGILLRFRGERAG
ncbi:hypothetical protein [Rubrobacter calidifluminis]|uniref:hypothetical protein n=1 Tax=Rubrobacter calidifluminis TaxID=1392640 RepID=UPI002360E811|nr:hypothetical protein [Rubrobacter calidifluminis]